MKKICKVTLNGNSFLAKCGDLLLDSALMNGVDLPHDCRSGACGACRVSLVKGQVFGGQDENDDTIHACQARVISDVEIAVERVPDQVSVSGRVAAIVRLSPDVFGVQIEIAKPFRFFPGQFCKLQFQGFPARSYSPTYPLEGPPNNLLLHFHIRRLSDGIVSSELGHGIRVGHRVRVTGPFGTAFLRPKHPGRIVLASSGTGFAPMWSVAVAAIMERPERELAFLVAAKNLQSLYMVPALCRLALFPKVVIIPIVSEPQSVSRAVRVGRLTDHLPVLSQSDVVYTSGAPAVTEHVARISKAAGARCYTDPFRSTAKSSEQGGFMQIFGLAQSSKKEVSKTASRLVSA